MAAKLKDYTTWPNSWPGGSNLFIILLTEKRPRSTAGDAAREPHGAFGARGRWVGKGGVLEFYKARRLVPGQIDVRSALSPLQQAQ